MSKTTEINILLQIKQVIFKNTKDSEHKFFLFGSRVNGKAKIKSDYDVGVIGKTKLNSIIKLDIEDGFESIPALIDFVDFAEVDENFKKIAMKEIKWLVK